MISPAIGERTIEHVDVVDEPALGMTIGIIQQRPRSVGAIHSVSADPVQPPAIHPRFLSAPEDRRRVVPAIRLARRLVARPSLAPLIAREMNPGPLAGDDDALLRWARATGQTLYHPCGTCRMGSDDAAVVGLARFEHHARGGADAGRPSCD